jgi:hypothetical protein
METDLFPPPGSLSIAVRRALEGIFPLLDRVFPVPARFRRELPGDVAELSRLLTSARNERSLSYLNRPPLLSAYLRYFLPWNLYRLCRILPALDLPLAAGDAVTDLGAGPLTFPVALWISRPELRVLPLEFRCIDRSGAVLDAGKRIFAALAGETASDEACPWTIKTIVGEIRPGPTHPLSVELRGKPAALVTALYLYNEIGQLIPPEDSPAFARLAGTQAAFLSGLAGDGGRILVVEPGVPRSGEFISLLRAAFLRLGCPPLTPCVHSGPCPLIDEGKKAAKWCHFAFDTKDAPEALRRLSASAGIPKERAVLSFLLAEKGALHTAVAPAMAADAAPVGTAQAPVTLRIISDLFPVAGGTLYGRYGCGAPGLVLVRAGRRTLEKLRSGALARVKLSGERDPKSGAPVGTMEDQQ